jgi:hypothetical protein
MVTERKVLGWTTPPGARKWGCAEGGPTVRFRAPGLAAILRATGNVGAVAQLGEHLLCKQGVAGSIPVRSIRLTFGSVVTSAIEPLRFLR